jgi:hypothetical protein
MNWRQINGELKSVIVQGDYLLGVNANDDIFCGKSAGDPEWAQLPGLKLKQISTDGKEICGTNAADDIFCADTSIYSNPNWRQLPGKLKYIDVNDGVLYGVNANNDIFFGASTGEPNWIQVDGKLKQLSFDGEVLCGVTDDDCIYCATSNLRSSPNWKRLGNLRYVNVYAGRLYGVNEGYNLFRKLITYPPQPIIAGWVQLEGKLKQVSYDGRTLCGVNTNEDIFCSTKGLEGTPNWRKVPGKLVYVVVYGDNLFGVNKENKLFVGNSIGNPSWKRLPGAFKQISTDGKQLCGSSTDDEVLCANENIRTTPNWRLVTGRTLKNVIVANGALYGTDSNDDVFVGHSQGRASWVQLPGKFKNLDFDGLRLCGTNSNDDIYCAENGLTFSPDWKQIDGKLSTICINAGRIIGTKASLDIFTRNDV